LDSSVVHLFGIEVILVIIVSVSMSRCGLLLVLDVRSTPKKRDRPRERPGATNQSDPIPNLKDRVTVGHDYTFIALNTQD
jgi:hypothetical protein